MSERRAIVLLSGGLDSATTAFIARRDGYRIHALSFRYGQRHAIELDAAARVANAVGAAEHVVMPLELHAFGGSALTDPQIAVPKHRDRSAIGSGIPITYVPARNTIFLSYALALAEVRGASDIFIGANHLDSSGYPDCRPEFLAAFEVCANLGTRAGVSGEKIRIQAPLSTLGKAAIIRLGLELGLDYSLTRSCYDPDEAGRACGACDSCSLRLGGFAEAGVPDPAPYQSPAEGVTG